MGHFNRVMNGREKLHIKEWHDEQKGLLAKRYNLCDKYSLEDEIQSAEIIRHCVENLITEAMMSEQPS